MRRGLTILAAIVACIVSFALGVSITLDGVPMRIPRECHPVALDADRGEVIVMCIVPLAEPEDEVEGRPIWL